MIGELIEWTIKLTVLMVVFLVWSFIFVVWLCIFLVMLAIPGTRPVARGMRVPRLSGRSLRRLL